MEQEPRDRPRNPEEIRSEPAPCKSSCPKHRSIPLPQGGQRARQHPGESPESAQDQPAERRTLSSELAAQVAGFLGRGPIPSRWSASTRLHSLAPPPRDDPQNDPQKRGRAAGAEPEHRPP